MSSIGRISGQLLKDNLLRQSNLNFKNTVSDTALLHLDINNRQIGINIESPSDVLEVNDQIRSDNYQSLYANIGNISFQYITNNGTNIGNEIVSNSGDLFLRSNDRINSSSIATDDINFNNNVISTYTTDKNLEIRPEGTGFVNIGSNTNETQLNITGSLYSTGNITFGANLTLGDSNEDNVDFQSDVNSDIIPDQTNTYSLGTSEKKYANLYSNLLNGQKVTVSNLNLDDVSLARRQGNIFYVSTLGNDLNVGDHQHGAFRTIKHALEVVDASSEGPVIIHIYPGVYEEEFPLVLPERVTISGEDIRNVVVKPTALTQNNSAFLLNQNCLVENLTVKDFYNPGYAFEFAPNALILERSPYVRNVTVLTQGSATSENDPRGFDAGDAGRGVLVDGSAVNNLTENPSMLFHSVTFITPGVDCVVMTNGVRVEWLNCFTYFANRGLHAIQGTGRLTSDNSTLEFGAEIRSIGSASVYGNYGAVADGTDTLMYLIGHNFAYIGSGKNVSNDRTLVLQDQETQELNQGRIYFTSTDADGTFRIGDAFYVNFEDGTTSINIDNINFTGVSSIIINDSGSITYIDGERIDLGNLRFSGNTIYSLDGDIIFKASTLKTFFDSNTGFQIAKGNTDQRKLEESDFRYNTDKNLFEGFGQDITTFAGVYSSDQNTYITANKQNGDIVFVIENTELARISGNNINLDDSSLGQFGNVELNGIYNNDISINNNIIQTTESNSNLELIPNGSSYTKLENLYVYSNVFENFENNNLSIFVTDRGYVKFDSTSGMVIPYGTEFERPETPEVGDTRWNTDKEYLEVWSGDEWQRAAGTGEEVTEEIFKDLVDIYTLVLG